jgi:hypothetical protein
MRDRRVSWGARVMAVSGVAYFFSTFQLIPDTMPVVGYLDDAAAISVSIYLMRLMVASWILADHTARLDTLSCNRTKLFSLRAALRSPASTISPSSQAASMPAQHEYNFLFVIAATLAAFIGFELFLRAVDHVIPDSFTYSTLTRWTVGLFIAFLGAFELLLRATGWNHPVFNQLDAVVGWRPRAGVRGTYDRFGEEGLVQISINSAGYRDDEHAMAKPSATFRIAILGDSLTEALEVHLQQTFWKRLEKILPTARSFSNRKVEVLNFAVKGYGTAQEYLILPEVLKYTPDLVLLAFFTGDDVISNSLTLNPHRNRPVFELVDGKLTLTYKPGETPHFVKELKRKDRKQRLLDDVRVYQFIRECRISIRSLSRYLKRWRQKKQALLPYLAPDDVNLGIYHPPQNEAWAEAWRVTEALLVAMDQAVRMSGGQFVLVTLSNPLQVIPDPKLREKACNNLGVKNLTYPDQRLAEFSGAHNIPCITLVDRLAKYADANGKIHLFAPEGADPHYRAATHDFIAHEIARAIEQLELASNR